MRHSKALESAGYDPATRTLRLKFRNGRTYDYLGVPAAVFDSLTSSAHPWTEWQTHIKAEYDYRPVSD
jgi:hypothetical protein